jgi:dolichol-phosphate mannosyltransferase
MEVQTSATAEIKTQETNTIPAHPEPKLSIIVPTRNEADNVKPLLERLAATKIDRSFEVIFVDDSTDNTPTQILAIKGDFKFDVSVIARPPERRNGLGMAVIEGMQAARGEWVVVMDGDLQHPPELISEMLKHADAKAADLVAGSRLAAGGSTAGLGWHREIISRVLATASRVIFPKNLRNMTDPLTGFFLFKKAMVDPSQLQPKGFKILLEILIRCSKLKVSEIPFVFGERHAGKSKANTREVIALFQQIVELRFVEHKYLLRFLAVGVSGLFVNTLLMYLFTDVLGIFYLLSAVLATQGSTFWNFEWTEKWVFGGRPSDRKQFWLRIISFFLMNNAMLLLRGPMLAIFVTALGMSAVAGNFLSLVIMTGLRFMIADQIIWRTGKKKPQKLYYYNIHDILRVRSMQKLPELGYFSVTQPFDTPDIDVRIDPNINAYRRENSIAYDEVLGQYGFSIVINQSETKTDVVASPVIGISPHVLYTNVVEPLLRWFFVRKGYALMHGACIAMNGNALFITARTDTGKTTTILNTLRESHGKMQFLSDDMTIVSRDGRALNYPKPLTISQHTLRAVQASPLTLREMLFLQLQSRLHSRGGRRAGMWLSNTMLPAATMNALVQKVIPPPKYMVHKLIPNTQYAKTARLSQIVVIERGTDFEGKIDEKEKISILVANAEDAYGFPPYPTLAHAISQWEGKDLHEKEADIVRSAVVGLPAIHLRSPRYDWYKRLPQLVQEPIVGTDLLQGATPSPQFGA